MSQKITDAEFQKLLGLYTMARRGALEGERSNARTLFLRRLEKTGISEERFHAYLEQKHPDKVLHERMSPKSNPPPSGSKSSPFEGFKNRDYDWAASFREMERHMREAMREDAVRRAAAAEERARRRDPVDDLMRDMRIVIERLRVTGNQYAAIQITEEHARIIMDALAKMYTERCTRWNRTYREYRDEGGRTTGSMV